MIYVEAQLNHLPSQEWLDLVTQFPKPDRLGKGAWELLSGETWQTPLCPDEDDQHRQR